MSKLTMKEIAKLANVSQATVSRVINGNKSVNEEAAKRVLKVIEEVGFIPNNAAQTLKRSHSNIIGVCVTETFNPYFVELIDTLELEARKRGYNILLHNSKHNPITEWESIQNFIARQVDGIILVPNGEYNIQRLNKLAIPTVIITKNRESLDSIGLDHMQAGKIAGENFIYAGHKKFGFIGTVPDEKYLGYNSVLYENGFELNSLINVKQTSTNNFLIQQDIEAYFNQADRLDFTCVFAANDIMALEFLKGAQKRGIRIPEDISLIGFDDTYLAKIMGISSIHQPIEEMVKTTIEILLNRIENEVSSEKINIQLAPTLIERKSSNFKR
ncbi:LacI family DNA-binding transcriptional regulator [Bacillus sp. ISL-40]|uniref:LacI family DNA-binding transcriptional regulator n=1 Tax=unclassified Bacillus (in: firmicutes) TaxID=185979 RepID=UPI001BE73782|nr:MULTISPECIES: LacI family DNA-binding transcriptional regulator [unclassified Bacillus (in: firmicutes)]MBT2698985.1 LacI family DNA-binding transcriptional regulator [Bacillus sp. ISL-40]MBT2724102.1 LacI family DNA-binding transcriptional regulator [Bacillus sp. ISL-46]MBT2744719.1 LacI family DNA-binding transcriptional regulator [Bacillus sp. ISL-77]